MKFIGKHLKSLLFISIVALLLLVFPRSVATAVPSTNFTLNGYEMTVTKGEVIILKKDQTGNIINKPGATFTVSPNPYGSGTLIVVDNGSNDANPAYGTIDLKNVPLGSYTVTETVAPAGYEKDSTPQTASVTSSAAVTLRFTNKKLDEIIILKKDQTGNIINKPGATFTVSPNPYGSGTLTVVDNDSNDANPANGTIDLKNVPLGSYTVTETVAPAGYERDSRPQTASVTSSAAVTISVSAAVTISVVNKGPKDLKAEVIATLSAATTGDKKIGEAIEHTQKSLTAELWVDATHLDPKHGNKVFDQEKDAIKRLQELIKDTKTWSRIKPVFDQAIGKLVNSDRLLADVAIKDARAYAGTSKEVDYEIAKAVEELAKAQEEITKGQPDNAVDRYRQAWDHAQHAIEHGSK